MRIRGSILLAIVVGVLIGAAAALSIYTWLDREHPDQPNKLSVPSDVSIPNNASTSTTIESEVRIDDLALPIRIQSIPDSFALTSDFDRRASLYLLLSNADESDFEQYIVDSLKISSRNQRAVALLIIFSRYAIVNPPRAVDRALKLDSLSEQEKGNLIWWIFNEWSVSDLDAAVTALHELPQEFRRSASMATMWRHDHLSAEEREDLARRIGPTDSWVDGMVNSIRDELIKTDPRKAYYDLLADSERNSSQTFDVTEAAKYWIEADGIAVLAEIRDSLKSAGARTSVLRNLIWNVFNEDLATPSSVLQEVSKFPSQQEARELTHAVFQAWANSNPKSSFEASLEYDDQLISDRLQMNLLRSWANDEPEELYEEAMTLPVQFQAFAIAASLRSISRDSSEEAIRLARNLDSSALRTSARDAIVSGWRSNDPKSAFEWLMNNSLDVQSPRDKTLWQHTFSMYLDEDYGSARKYVDAYEGEFRDSLVVATAEHLLDLDVERAIDYIKTAGKEISESLAHEVAFSLSEYDPMEALSFGETLEERLRKDYYESVIYSWADDDFIGLFDNIYEFPSKYQSLVAKRLLEFDARTYRLSELEVKKLESMIESDKDPIAVY